MATGVTTEWEDIQVQKGNWKAAEHVATGEELFLAQQEGVVDYDNYKGLSGQQIEDQIEDDWDLEDDAVLAAYRDQRVREMKAKAGQHEFLPGVVELTKQDYEWHTQNMPKGTLGVVHLYQD
jgi:hypothetical protein